MSDEEQNVPPAEEPKPSTDRSPAEKFRDGLTSKQTEDDDEERTLWEGGYSGKAMTGSWIIAGIVSIGLLVATIMWFSSSTGWMVLAGLLVVIWAALGLTLMVRKYSIHYELTTQRFIHMEGLLKRVADRIEVIDIDDVTYQQGLVERMVGVGNIKISSSDRSHPELWMRGIENVKDIANMIDEVRRKERRRRGVHIEAI